MLRGTRSQGIRQGHTRLALVRVAREAFRVRGMDLDAWSRLHFIHRTTDAGHEGVRLFSGRRWA